MWAQNLRRQPFRLLYWIVIIVSSQEHDLLAEKWWTDLMVQKPFHTNGATSEPFFTNFYNNNIIEF